VSRRGKRPGEARRIRPVGLRTNRRLGLVALACLVALPFGCADRKVRISTDATGGTANRSFAASELRREDLARLRTAYASEPVADAATGGRRVEGRFDDALPRELGNRNGLSEIRTSLGTTRFYYEALSEPADEWPAFRRRMDAGELWLRLFAAWSESRIKDPSLREEWKAHVEGTLVPLCGDIMMMYSAMQASVQTQRIGARIRDTDDFAPMTDDERFRQQTFLPLLLLLGERGIFDTGEMQRLLLIGNDGNASAAERKWATDRIIFPAILRQVQRFNPSVKELSTPQLVGLGFGFLLYANTPSPSRDAVLLASPAVSDEDKERLRAGGPGAAIVTLPPPFGVDPRRRPKATEAEVRLRTGTKPWLTNGIWEESSGEVVFRAKLFDAANRTVLYAPVFHANWCEPDAAEQERLFGALLLDGAALADYALWLEALPDAERTAWNAALAALRDRGEIRPLAKLAAGYARNRPLPGPLRDWIARRSGPTA